MDEAAVLAALEDAVRSAWSTVAALDPPEQTYGLVLYEGAEHGYVCVTAMTEEGLDRVTAEYRERYGEHDREDLRWSVPDSPHHVVAEVGQPPLPDEADVDQVARVRDLCRQAFTELDAEGLFTPDRERLTLMLLSRDEVETVAELRADVAALNPPEVAERYDAHLRSIGHTFD